MKNKNVEEEVIVRGLGTVDFKEPKELFKYCFDHNTGDTTITIPSSYEFNNRLVCSGTGSTIFLPEWMSDLLYVRTFVERNRKKNNNE